MDPMGMGHVGTRGDSRRALCPCALFQETEGAALGLRRVFPRDCAAFCRAVMNKPAFPCWLTCVCEWVRVYVCAHVRVHTCVHMPTRATQLCAHQRLHVRWLLAPAFQTWVSVTFMCDKPCGPPRIPHGA